MTIYFMYLHLIALVMTAQKSGILDILSMFFFMRWGFIFNSLVKEKSEKKVQQ